jgi:hypothetical protein
MRRQELVYSEESQISHHFRAIFTENEHDRMPYWAVSKTSGLERSIRYDRCIGTKHAIRAYRIRVCLLPSFQTELDQDFALACL